MIGGVAEGWAFYFAMMLRAWLHPMPNTADYLGPVISLAILGAMGAGAGFLTGVVTWGLAELGRTSEDVDTALRSRPGPPA